MRIVCTLNDQKKGSLISIFLASHGIENQLEINTNTDWGSPNYGDVTCRVWVYDEDQVQEALKWIDLFEKDPNHPVFQKAVIPTPLPIVTEQTRGSKSPPPAPPAGSFQSASIAEEPLGKMTLSLLIICCLLFIICELTTPMITSIPNTLPSTPFTSSTIKKSLLYDYPKAFELVDKLIKLYGSEKLQTPQDLPSEGKYLLAEFYRTPYWRGLYNLFFQKYGQTQSLNDPSLNAPLFEKIRQGEIWRTFSPCLLHNDILHILFNMLWLIVLGKQMELRLGKFRYLTFVVLAGILTNTFQYLMSGANFIGFSGILCAMLTFIWIRQKVAPWEGYPLQKTTIAFMMLFILAMFFIQLMSFYLEFDQQLSISPGIANTAHLSGAILGALFGYLPFFSWKA